MKDIRLEDGTWVTSAVAPRVEVPVPQCPDDTCKWENFGSPTPKGLLPVPVQIQRCGRCQWMRGLYLGNPYPSLTIDNQEIQGDEICILAGPANLVNLSSYKVINLIPCVRCGQVLFIEEESVPLLAKGAIVSCLPCALECRPEMTAGKDPDTGRLLTLREVVAHPNNAGKFSHKDIKRN